MMNKLVILKFVVIERASYYLPGLNIVSINHLSIYMK